jgi:hypothetical protein
LLQGQSIANTAKKAKAPRTMTPQVLAIKGHRYPRDTAARQTKQMAGCHLYPTHNGNAAALLRGPRSHWPVCQPERKGKLEDGKRQQQVVRHAHVRACTARAATAANLAIILQQHHHAATVYAVHLPLR